MCRCYYSFIPWWSSSSSSLKTKAAARWLLLCRPVVWCVCGMFKLIPVWEWMVCGCRGNTYLLVIAQGGRKWTMGMDGCGRMGESALPGWGFMMEYAFYERAVMRGEWGWGSWQERSFMVMCERVGVIEMSREILLS